MRKTPINQPTLFALDPPPLKPISKQAPKRAQKSAPALSAAVKVKPVAVKTPRAPVPSAGVLPAALRSAMERSGAEGHAWRMSSRHAVAYLRCAVLASELLATDTRHLANAAMAVYYDRKGKAFAWQVRFDAERWEEVTARLG